jgi:hypothetical protein
MVKKPCNIKIRDDFTVICEFLPHYPPVHITKRAAITDFKIVRVQCRLAGSQIILHFSAYQRSLRRYITRYFYSTYYFPDTETGLNDAGKLADKIIFDLGVDSMHAPKHWRVFNPNYYPQATRAYISR